MTSSTFVPPDTSKEVEAIAVAHMATEEKYTALLTEAQQKKTWETVPAIMAFTNDRLRPLLNEFSNSLVGIDAEVDQIFNSTTKPNGVLSDLQRRDLYKKLDLAQTRVDLTGDLRDKLIKIRDIVQTKLVELPIENLSKMGALIVKNINTLSASYDQVQKNVTSKAKVIIPILTKAPAAESKGTAVSGSHAAVANQLPPVVAPTKAADNTTAASGTPPTGTYERKAATPGTSPSSSPKSSAAAAACAFTSNMGGSKPKPSTPTATPPLAQPTAKRVGSPA